MGFRYFQSNIDQYLCLVWDGTNEALMAPMTIEEVKEAVFHMRVLKALDLDGLNGQFYHRCGGIFS